VRNLTPASRSAHLRYSPIPRAQTVNHCSNVPFNGTKRLVPRDMSRRVLVPKKWNSLGAATISDDTFTTTKIASLYEEHDEQWMIITEGSNLRASWNTIPWPVLKHPKCPADITNDRVHAYVLSRWHPRAREQPIESRIHEYAERWVSGRAKAALLISVDADERQMVEDGISSVVCALDALRRHAWSSFPMRPSFSSADSPCASKSKSLGWFSFAKTWTKCLIPSQILNKPSLSCSLQAMYTSDGHPC
jgi:hypothetical protein